MNPGPWGMAQTGVPFGEVETVRDWIDETNPRFSFRVAKSYITAQNIPDSKIISARQIKIQVLNRMNDLLSDKAVICLPTTIGPAPSIGQKLSEQTDLGLKTSQLTCIAGTTGGPQINLPLAHVEGMPVGISLLGARGDDEVLIEVARQLGSQGYFK